MKKIILSTTTIALLGTNILADDKINDIFTDGKFSGDITFYSEHQNNKGTNADTGFDMGSIGLNYETASFNNFKASVGFRANKDFYEKGSDDYSDGSDPRSIFGVANISYEDDNFAVIAGRQEIDLEWIGDFHYALLAVIKNIPNTTLTVGHTDKFMKANSDEALVKIKETNGNDGVCFADVKYDGIENFIINPYYYNADDLANWYGAKIDYDNDMFGLTGHYAKSSEEVANTADGSIFHFEARGSIEKLNLNAGYIETDNDGEIGAMDTIGDNINPLKDGNQVYELNADTSYLSASYEINDFSLNLIYGTTDYAENSKEKELNAGIDYSINDNISLSALYVDVDAQTNTDDYDKFLFTATYSF